MVFLFSCSLLLLFLTCPVHASIQQVPDEQVKITTNLVKIQGANLKIGLGSIDRQLGSNNTAIVELQGRTNNWNYAYTYTTTNRIFQDATNSVYTTYVYQIEARTNAWNAITNATNQIIELQLSTNYWNGGGACSARVDQLEARTNYWNSAYTNMLMVYSNLSIVSNMVVELEVRTNDWNSAFEMATSNDVHVCDLHLFSSNATATITGSVSYAVYRTSTTNRLSTIQCTFGDQAYYPTTTNIYVEIWGAGGGGNAAISGAGYGGGGGAFISGYLAVTNGELLTVVVGAGGNYNIGGIVGPMYGGGGQGKYAGAGGGRSAIRRGSIDLVTAGAGGGGGNYINNSAGGPGGITSGTNGSAGASPGTGGSQVSGGTGYIAGGLNYGGNATTSKGGGGGGSGYYGGGAGGLFALSYNCSGGGGSSLTNGFYQVGTCQGGTGYVPGGTNATYYNPSITPIPGWGGAYVYNNGSPGMVVIREEPFTYGAWIQQTPNVDYTLSMVWSTNLNSFVMTISTTNALPSDYKIFYRD